MITVFTNLHSLEVPVRKKKMGWPDYCSVVQGHKEMD